MIKSIKIIIIAILLCIFFVFVYGTYIHQNFSSQSEFKEKEVVLNPYKNAPLSALFKTNINEKWKIKILVKWKWESGIDISNEFVHEWGNVELPILWLYPDYENKIEISFYTAKWKLKYSEDFLITTTPLSQNISLELEVLENSLLERHDSLYVFIGSPAWFDQNGDVRWYLDNESYDYIWTKLKNGNVIVSSTDEKIYFHSKYFYEISMLWEIIKEYSVDNLFHHELLELENGNFLLSSNSQKFSSMKDPVYRDDTIIEIDRKTWNIIYELNMDSILPWMKPPKPEHISIPHPSWKKGWEVDISTGSWANINSVSVYWDNIIVSLRQLSTILSVHRPTWDLNWILSDKSYLPDSVQHKLLKIPKLWWENFEYVYPIYQHTPTITSSWTLLVFDNGTKRYEISWEENGREYSRVLEYTIDEQEMTAELVYSYTDPEYIYAPVTGSVYELYNNHKLIWYTHNIWSHSQLIELNSKYETMLHIQDVSWRTYYRVIKIDLY